MSGSGVEAPHVLGKMEYNAGYAPTFVPHGTMEYGAGYVPAFVPDARLDYGTGYAPALVPTRVPAIDWTSDSLPLTDPVNRAVKRAFECPVALAACLALLPVMGVVALAVKLTSRGELIHRRRVAGLGGQSFDAYKFRTMVPDADAWIQKDRALRSKFAAKFKLEDDPRVTPVGRVLRKFSLDELPQLVNVLKGQMSLVGPRMITPEELTKYGAHAGRLLTVKPGLTGLWQVSGRQTTTYDRRVELDMQYIENWSLKLDLAILARTPKVVVSGRGAV
jgi:lipopolysaccharide/colanic/teichoic acid biosynthesis glycosyltransferase